MGEDTLYSGTVAAATEGIMFGVPAIAFSLVDKGWPIWRTPRASPRKSSSTIVHIRCRASRCSTSIFRNLPYDELKGWKVTRLGKRHPSQPVIRQTDPRGEPIYWIGAAGEALDASDGTDFHAVANGFVSITPLQLDLTHADAARDARMGARRRRAS